MVNGLPNLLGRARSRAAQPSPAAVARDTTTYVDAGEVRTIRNAIRRANKHKQAKIEERMERVSVRLPDDLIASLDRIADNAARDRSFVVRAALEMFVSAVERNPAAIA